MKKILPYWTFSLAGGLLLGAGGLLSKASNPPDADLAKDQDSHFDSTNQVTLSVRFGFDIGAKFSGIGSAAGLGHYFDGYVLPDSTGDYLGYTSNWGYDHGGNGPASQYNETANTFSFHNPTDGGGSANDNGGIMPGVELTYDRQLGVKEDWHNLRYGVEGAINYMNISLNNNSGFNTPVSTEVYQFGGIQGQPPAAGFRGGYSGNPGDPVLVANGTPGLPTAGTLQTQDNLDANLFGGRVGPYIELPFGKKEQFTLALSAGLAAGLIDANESWTETLTLSGGGGASTISGGGNNCELLWGWYCDASAKYQINKRWGVDAGVQFQDLGTYDHDFGGRTVELDLSKSVFLHAGISFSF